ncbi:hypothetical protein Angca_002692, partial [Angiostrongylus cantonensis]
LDKWVPHKLNDSIIKNLGFEVLSTLILSNKNHPFHDRTVTCDEARILYETGDVHLNSWIAI